MKNVSLSQSVLAHAFNSNTREWGPMEFEESLFYTEKCPPFFLGVGKTTTTTEMFKTSIFLAKISSSRKTY